MEGNASPKDFKFIFNNVLWNPGELQKEVDEGRWDIVKVPPQYILSQDSRAGLWSMARNKLRMNTEANESDE